MVPVGVGTTTVGSDGVAGPDGTTLGSAMSTSTTGSTGGAGNAGHGIAAEFPVVVAKSALIGARSGAGRSMAVAQGTRNTHSEIAAGSTRLGTSDGAGPVPPSGTMLGDISGPEATGAGLEAAGGAVSPPVSAGAVWPWVGAGESMGWQSQSQIQFHVHSSPVPSPASVEIAVVVPHQSNVHVQSHEGSPEPAGREAGAGEVFV